MSIFTCIYTFALLIRLWELSLNLNGHLSLIKVKFHLIYSCLQTSALLMSKPGAVFQITVERHPSGKARINRQNSMEDYSDDRKGEFRTRSISLFTRRVFKRSPHAIDHKSSPEINRKDGAASERDIKPKSQEPPNNRHKAARSSSLPRRLALPVKKTFNRFSANKLQERKSTSKICPSRTANG